MISMALVIQLVVASLIFYVLWWGLQKIAPPEPINKILTVLLVLLIVCYLINFLFGLGGKPLFRY